MGNQQIPIFFAAHPTFLPGIQSRWILVSQWLWTTSSRIWNIINSIRIWNIINSSSWKKNGFPWVAISLKYKVKTWILAKAQTSNQAEDGIRISVSQARALSCRIFHARFRSAARTRVNSQQQWLAGILFRQFNISMTKASPRITIKMLPSSCTSPGMDEITIFDHLHIKTSE